MAHLYTHIPRRRILIVDDDAAQRTMLGLILTAEGYAVSHADNGYDAAFLHNQKPFDLIIAELFLDQEGGLQALMQLQRQPTPVNVIATAKEDLASASLCLHMTKHLGTQSVLGKPVKREELLTAVRKALPQL